MTYLMVNLNDPADCREAIHRLRDLVQRGCGPGKRRPRRGENAVPPTSDEPRDPTEEPQLGRPRPGDEQRGPERGFGSEPGKPRRGRRATAEHLHDLPLPKKVDRIAQRGVFRHLHRIATEIESPMSLPELDRQLGFQPNKMRSLKAIMAKLEHRFDLQFLVPDPDGSVDENGNPRYVMPVRIKNQILRISA